METSQENFIELNAFLKVNLLATTGGQAKNIIRSGNIFLNGVVETRNKKKLFSGDVIKYNDKEYVVRKEICLMKR